MPNIPSATGLHMRYRLWIAEMNHFINILRILEDYLAELSPKENVAEIKTGIDYFKNEFLAVRKNLDDLRHEMHIMKMKLATYTREGQALTEDIYREDKHEDLENQFKTTQQKFEDLKGEFAAFEDKWSSN